MRSQYRLGALLFMIAFAAFLVFPMLLLFSVALQDQGYIAQDSGSGYGFIPTHYTLANFKAFFDPANSFLRGIGVSLMLFIPATIIAGVLSVGGIYSKFFEPLIRDPIDHSCW